MNIIRVANVNEALYRGVQLFDSGGARLISPRGKRTIEWPEPVATVYERPLERVIFSTVRDANPFFHFFESLWMLRGRNDVDFCVFFNKRMSEFSDDQKVFHGAYGFRWHHWFKGGNQLAAIVKILKDDPASRRAVLTMWDPDADLAGAGRDLPCNTHIYFKIRDGKLNMAVCNRSNDMIWGAYGANAVHMSFLLEYMAAQIGVEVGTYTQISDSFHVYLDGPGGELWDKLKNSGDLMLYDFYSEDHVEEERVKPYPLLHGGANMKDFDEDLMDFFEGWDQRDPEGDEQQPDKIEFRTPFFEYVVAPMYAAWRTRKVMFAEGINASDWRKACVEWIQRRPAK